jgi:5'-3' exonuclease
MVEEDSPIIDFYPSTFEIDMNGKKMAWQGVALLPFIDEKRLLSAMATQYPNLTEDEIRRNRWGDNVMFASDEHPLYPFFEPLFGKRKKQEVILFPLCMLSANILCSSQWLWIYLTVRVSAVRSFPTRIACRVRHTIPLSHLKTYPT